METKREIAVKTDTELAELYWNAFKAKADLGDYASYIHSLSGSEYERRNRGGRFYTRSIKEAIESGVEKSWNQQSFEQSVAKYRNVEAELQEYKIAIKGLEEIYKKYLWNRAFYVPAGHVHKSRNCSTCYDSTEFAWLPKYSGGSEDEIVNDAGEDACTVCYPSAPAEVLNRPSVIVTADKVEKAKAKAERDEAKAKRKAKQIASAPTADGEPLVVSAGEFNTKRIDGKSVRVEGVRREQIATERTAKIWYVDKSAYANWMKPKNPEARDWDVIKESLEKIVYALAEKHGVDPEVVRDELEKKVQARLKRDRG